MGFKIFFKIAEKILLGANFFLLAVSCLPKGTIISPFAKIIFYNNIEIGKNCRIPSGCIFRVPKTSRLVIGDNCAFREYTQLMCREKTTTEFGNNCFIGSFCFISDQIKFGNNVILGPYCSIIAGRHNFKQRDVPINMQGSSSLPIEIGSNVWLGAHVIIIGPSKIGSNSIIGAGVIFKGNVPESSLVKSERKNTVSKLA
ncbi:MAG TPA: DapH/DapD/GlmU-related protein [archaeon]|nr:DapH/DapD/GlmU-related protein [archaeon]